MLCRFSAMGLAPEINVMYVCMYVLHDQLVGNKQWLFSAGFHNRWNVRVGVRHPNLWVFCRKMKDEERCIQRVINAADRGDAPPTRKRRYRRLQERIARLKAEYVAGTRDLSSYWRAVAHVVHEFNWNVTVADSPATG